MTSMLPKSVTITDDTMREGLQIEGSGEKYQWWVDTRNFREDAPTTARSNFNGWAI